MEKIAKKYRIYYLKYLKSVTKSDIIYKVVKN